MPSEAAGGPDCLQQDSKDTSWQVSNTVMACKRLHTSVVAKGFFLYGDKTRVCTPPFCQRHLNDVEIFFRAQSRATAFITRHYYNIHCRKLVIINDYNCDAMLLSYFARSVVWFEETFSSRLRTISFK